MRRWRRRGTRCTTGRWWNEDAQPASAAVSWQQMVAGTMVCELVLTVQLYCGDCLDVLPTLAENSVDTIVTDPPYGLGFMGKDWDRGVPGVPFWVEMLRVVKPGAMLLAFGGTRTFHRLTCAIEDAGWEIRDCVMWLYGSGFPKSHDISKAIDKEAGAEREVTGVDDSRGHYDACERKDGQRFTGTTYNHGKPGGQKKNDITSPATPDAALWDGWGTALKPAWEPIILAMKPCDETFTQNALTWGVAGLWIDGGRIATRLRHNGNGTSSPAGRWPANLILDEESAAMLDEQSGELKSGDLTGQPRTENKIFNSAGATLGHPQYWKGDTGGASRFFYCAKASRAERDKGLERTQKCIGNECYGDGLGNGPDRISQANHHSTVKPLALMRYLIRLTKTPTGGIVLDPFMGSGSTGVAAVLEGRSFIGIDTDPIDVAEARIADAQAEMIQTSFI